MAHGPGGKPVVPPSCPTPKEGFIPDLSDVPFELQVRVSPNLSPPLTEVVATFGVAADGGPSHTVDTGFVVKYVDVPWSQRLHGLVGLPENPTKNGSVAVHNTDNSFVENVRKQFCARVAKCEGVIDGECWALGRKAVIEVIEVTPAEDTTT